MADANVGTANRMAGGILPEDIAVQMYSAQLSEINEFSSLYPFDIVETIEYVPPVSALVVSNGAASGGGALWVTTKSAGGSKLQGDDTFLRICYPLGYQLPLPQVK